MSMIVVENNDINEYKNFLNGINYEIEEFNEFSKLFEINDRMIDILSAEEININNISEYSIKITEYGKIIVNRNILKNHEPDQTFYILQR